MATQTEIEAAVEAIHNAHTELGIDRARFYAELALEAADKVRPKRKDGTITERSRRFRAKRNGVMVAAHNNGVAAAGGNGVADDSGNGVARFDNGLRLLRDRLLEAAAGNVQPGATDLSAIERLLAQGCDLDLDVLPAVRELLTDPLQPPLKSWGLPWVGEAILARRDMRVLSKPRTGGTVRTSSNRTSVPPSPPAPGLPSLDLGELVAGYRAGMVEWNAARLGPPPDSPGVQG